MRKEAKWRETSEAKRQMWSKMMQKTFWKRNDAKFSNFLSFAAKKVGCFCFAFVAKLSKVEVKRKMWCKLSKKKQQMSLLGMRARKYFASFRSCFPKWCGSRKKNPFSQNDADTCESGSKPATRAVSHIKNVICLRDISHITTHCHRLIIWGLFWDVSPPPYSLQVAFSMHKRVICEQQGEK